MCHKDTKQNSTIIWRTIWYIFKYWVSAGVNDSE